MNAKFESISPFQGRSGGAAIAAAPGAKALHPQLQTTLRSCTGLHPFAPENFFARSTAHGSVRYTILKTERFRTKRAGGCKIERSLPSTCNHRFRTVVRFFGDPPANPIRNLSTRPAIPSTVAYGHPGIFWNAPPPTEASYGHLWTGYILQNPGRSPRSVIATFSNRLVTDSNPLVTYSR